MLYDVQAVFPLGSMLPVTIPSAGECLLPVLPADSSSLLACGMGWDGMGWGRALAVSRVPANQMGSPHRIGAK